jgi:uncharacterized protein (DUF1697 family)
VPRRPSDRHTSNGRSRRAPVRPRSASRSVQSGNIVFEWTNPEPIKALEERMHQAISEKFGFDIPVIIRTAQEWADSITRNPFLPEKDGEEGRIYLTFLQNEPSKESLEKIQGFQYLPDQFEIIGREVYIYCKSGYGTSKLSNPFFESKLKVAATTRNWNTVMKLYEMVV